MKRMKPMHYYSSQRDNALRGDVAPPEPHLAVRINESTVAPIPPGVHMFIVRDPAQINGVFELVFEKIKFVNDRPTEIHFIVPQNGGSRKCIMNVRWEGDYKEWTRRDAERAAQEAEAQTKATGETASNIEQALKDVNGEG